MPDRGPVKPTSAEEEYFAREEAEKKRKASLDAQRQLAADERRRLRELHHMHCPKCGMRMETVKLRGLTVDTCFSCGGVFLDRSEIDVIAAPEQKGIMAAILNWFSDESRAR